jgi:hypothetical protein
MEGDQDAWVWVQQYLREAVRRWLYYHPRREEALCLDSEEHYVARTFERFWQLAHDRQFEFSTLTKVLLHLRLSLNGAILDTLRTSSQPKEVQFQQTDFLRKQQLEDETSCNGVWERFHKQLLNIGRMTK